MISTVVRTVAFLRKEITEILRQPRLIATLVLGPFAILFLFGVGYRNEGRALLTVFVAPDNDPIQAEIRKMAPNLRPHLQFAGITSDLEGAKRRLQNAEVDLVVVAPSNALETIRKNKQAVFSLYHNEIDPYQADYIRYTGEMYVGKLNHWLLATTVESKKGDVGLLQADLRQTSGTTKQLRGALQKGDIQAARGYQKQLYLKLESMEATYLSQLNAVSGQADATAQEQLRAVLDRIRSAREKAQSMTELQDGRPDYADETERAETLEKDLLLASTRLEQLRSIDAKVLFAPFSSNTQGLLRTQPKLSEYFTPSVIILLLQHLAITFAALSIVREMRAGTMEIFKVSPLRAGEILIGKYLGYVVVAAIVALALTALLVSALKVQMLGDWYSYAAVLLAVVFTSLGLGFLLSLMAKTESQAIQYSMIALLMSIFFTGFLLDLRMLWQPVRLVSWALPATYGIRLLQDIVLRGIAPEPFLLAVLCGIGVFLFALVSKLLSRRMARI